MPGFWQRLLQQSPSSNGTPIPIEFANYAANAIQLLTAADIQITDEQIISLFSTNNIPHKEAVELLLFLPIAFCRNLLPQIDWPNYYWEYISERKRIKHLYAENKRYKAIQEALQDYLAGNFTKTDYHKIAGRSASFHAINQLLLDNPTRKLAEVLVTPETIIY
jgi:hypothetical protein